MKLTLVTTLLCVLKVVHSATIWGCDFDMNSDTPCGMSQSTQDAFNWRPHQFETQSKNTGPLEDHTSGQGYYMYIEASDHSVGEYADLDTPSLTDSSAYCVTFWYHMYGQHIGSLAVFTISSSGGTQEVWSRTRQGSTGINAWQEDSITVTGATQKVRFRAVRGGENDGQPYGDIAIDDVIIENKACGAPDVTTESTSTTTESTTVSTTTTTTPPSTSTSTTTTPSTSPSTTAESTTTSTPEESTVRSSTSAVPTSTAEEDTTGTPSTSEDKSAEIVTTVQSPNTTYTVSSSSTQEPILPSSTSNEYNMSSSSTSPTNLSSSSTDSSKFSSPSTTTSPSITKAISTSTSTMSSSMTSQSVAVNASEATIITRNSTLLFPTEATKSSVPSDSVTASNEVFRCEFAPDDLCGLVQSGETDDFDWELHSGYTPSEPTGPRVDHTTGTEEGYYLYAEASNRQASDRAIISYPTSSLEQQTACMSFWYHMFGQHVGTLKVTEVKEGGQVNTLWEHSGDQGDQWYPGHVTIAENTSKLQFIAIQGGDRSSEVQGDIALDDLLVRTGPCSLYTTTQPTTPAPTTTDETTESDSSEELWGLDETYWIIILAVAGSVILILLLVIVCQACALSNIKHSSSAQITRRTNGDFDNFDGYTKYSGANGNSATPSSSSAPGYINAYENGAYNP